MADSGRQKAGKSRRDVLIDAARTACGVAAAGFGLAALATQSKALPVVALRPPGALTETDFLAACVRCGTCVRDCPYDILQLAELGDGPAHGSPYFVARALPCEMCEDIPCVKACPTGALDSALTDINDARMGTAVLLGRETCLNLLGLRCDICHRVCPLIDEAITLEMRHNARSGGHVIFEPVVHASACTGCGKCEKACVLEEAAIKVLPQRLAAIGSDTHYRPSREEPLQAGEPPMSGARDPLNGAPQPLPPRFPGGGS